MSRKRNPPTAAEVDAFALFQANEADLLVIRSSVDRALKYRFGWHGESGRIPPDGKPKAAPAPVRPITCAADFVTEGKSR